WLTEAAAGATDEAAEAPSMSEPAAPSPIDMPDWLTEAAVGATDEAAEAPSMSEPAAPSPIDMPDWFDTITPGPTGESVAAPPESAVPSSEETSDWLSSMLSSRAEEPSDALGDLFAEPAAPPDEAVEPAIASPEPSDALSELFAEPAAPPDEAVEPAITSPEPSDALSELFAEPAAPQDEAVEPAIASPEPSDALSELFAEPAAPSDEAVELADDLAGALGDLFAEMPELPVGESEAGEPVLVESADLPAPATTEPVEDLLGWSASNIEFSDAPISIRGGEDLLGLTNDFLPSAVEEEPAETEASEAEELVSGELPTWLQSAQSPEAAEISPSPAPPPKSAPDLLDQMDALRFEAIIGDTEQPPSGEPAKVGALKDVVGVIHPEMVFDGGSLTTSDLTGGLTITDVQKSNISRLEKLLETEKEEIVVLTSGRTALPLARWLITLVMLVAVAVPVMLDFKILPIASQTPGAADADALLSGLANDATVLMAFEYEPESAAELKPLATALLKQIADREGVTVYAVSTRPTGPAMADEVYKQVFPPAVEAPDSSTAEESSIESPNEEDGLPSQPEERWINIGFIPGGANGISDLVLGSPENLPSRLSYNYRGLPTGIVQHSLKEHSPALIIVIAARSEDLRPWVEQAGLIMDTKILAATSAGSAPMTQPYRRSGQVSALLIGINDAMGYRSLSGSEPDPSLVTTWNAQALGGLAATLSIIVGGVFYGLTSRRKQQEHSR
ncbi:MAG: hypothetical protein JXB07_01525, partial [Anaerolineae bacterium]|nr:hypothetical protein [Anaerolineae bacterium]